VNNPDESLLLQTQVSVDQLWSDEEEVTSVGPGENVKIKLKVRSRREELPSNKLINRFLF